MHPLTVLRNALFGYFIAVATTTLPAADKGSSGLTSDWSIRTYRLQPEDLLELPASPESNPDPFGVPSQKPPAPKPPELPDFTVPIPFATASEVEQMVFIKSCTDRLLQALKSSKLTVPEGALFAYDANSFTLSVRANTTYHHRLAATESWRSEAKTSHMNFRLDILETDAATMRAAVRSAATKSDHTSILQDLEARADQGLAQRITSVKLDTKRNQRAHLSTGAENWETTAFSLDEKLRPSFTKSPVKAGMDLEIDAFSSDDHTGIDLTYALTYDYAPPTKEWATVPIPAPRPLLVPVYQHRKTASNSSIAMKQGSVQLLNVWSTDETIREPKSLQAAFLHGNIVILRPLVNPSVEAMLRKWSEQISPAPKLPPEQVKKSQPEAMQWRRFRFPSGCRFGPDANIDPQPSPASLREILTTLGVEFPPGATIEHTSEKLRFAFYNTRKNLDFLEHRILEISDHESHPIVTTLQIIQADAKLLRKLEQEMADLSDHTAAWQSIEAAAAHGQIQFLSTQPLTTKDGQRAKTSTGEEKTLVGLKPGPDPKQPTFESAYDSNLIGTSLEVDPVLDSDGLTVDLALAFSFDYAPPTDTPRPAGNPGKNALLLGGPEQTLHRFSLSTSLTLSAGQPRLLSIWKPDVTPAEKPSAAPADVLQAAFIRVDLIPLE